MGLSMCGHVLDAGYAVTVHNRTRERAEPLLEKGASWADTPAEVAAASDVVCSIVGYPADVREVSSARTARSPARAPGAVLVDLTTSEPSLAVEIYERAAEKGVASIDAPVSGGDVGARNATLSIMVGGDEDAVERVRPLFEVMGKTIVHQGGPGRGAAHEDGQPDADRDGDDRRLRGAAVRLQGGARPGDGARVGRARRGRIVVADELRAADAEGRLRARLRRRALRQGHGHRPRGGAADEPVATRALRSPSSCTSPSRPRARAARERSPSSSRSPPSPTWTGKPRRPTTSAP